VQAPAAAERIAGAKEMHADVSHLAAFPCRRRR
jgi:hypothetical protein